MLRRLALAIAGERGRAPMAPADFRWLAIRLVVPTMLITAIFNQQRAHEVLLFIGRAVSPLSILVAAGVVLLTFRHTPWAAPMVLAAVGLRAARVVTGESAELVVLYTVAAGLVFCAAGTVAAIQRPALVYRQLVAVCALNLPLMLLQLLGAGEWTQLMRSDIHDVERDLTQYPTLFVGSGDWVASLLQARPAGFFPSNNLLSVVLVITLALHYARPERRVLTWRDVLLGAVVVLAMAKVALLMFVILMVWSLLGGNWRKRGRALVALVLYATLAAFYALLFPGVFAYNTSWEAIALNLTIRLADFALATDIDAARRLAQDLPENVLALADDPLSRQSGYASVARLLPYLLVVAVVLAPFAYASLRWLRRTAAAWSDTATSMLLAVLVIPLITSFVEAPIYWFFAGFALLPLIVVMEPRCRLLFLATDQAGGTEGRRVASGRSRTVHP